MVDFEIDIKKVSWIPKHVEDWPFRRAIGVEDSQLLQEWWPKPSEYFVVRDLSYLLGKLVSSRCWGYRAHMILQGIQDIWLEEMPATVDCHLL